MNIFKLVFVSFVLFELAYLSQGEEFSVDSICFPKQRPSNSTFFRASGLKNDSRVAQKAVGNWSGTKSLKDFCTQDKKVQGFKLHTAIAILGKYVTALRERYNEMKNLMKSYGCSCGCRETTLVAKIQNVKDSLCFLYWEVNMKTPYNGNFSISLDTEKVTDISITKSFKKIESFAKCIMKKDKKKNIDDCAKIVFKECGRNRKGRKGRKRGPKRRTRKNNAN